MSFHRHARELCQRDPFLVSPATSLPNSAGAIGIGSPELGDAIATRHPVPAMLNQTVGVRRILHSPHLIKGRWRGHPAVLIRRLIFFARLKGFQIAVFSGTSIRGKSRHNRRSALRRNASGQLRSMNTVKSDSSVSASKSVVSSGASRAASASACCRISSVADAGRLLAVRPAESIIKAAPIAANPIRSPLRSRIAPGRGIAPRGTRCAHGPPASNGERQEECDRAGDVNGCGEAVGKHAVEFRHHGF